MGGGGGLDAKCGINEMFERMCAWDDQNYVMAAGTRAGLEEVCAAWMNGMCVKKCKNVLFNCWFYRQFLWLLDVFLFATIVS